MISRILTTIIIPIILSFLLLNNCGNGWTKLWNPCLNDPYSFDMYGYLTPSNIIINSTYIYAREYAFADIGLEVSYHSEICSSLTFNNISWNKCIRTFLFKWCNVLIIKMIVMFFIPIWIIIYKSIKIKIFSITKYKKEKEIEIDS
eukprot:81054_1